MNFASFLSASVLFVSNLSLLSVSLAFSPNPLAKLPIKLKNSRGHSFFRTQKIWNDSHSRQTHLSYVPYSDNMEDAESILSSQDTSKPWTMAEDWELIDQVPKFTVGEGDHCRTFWTQMAACTPILSYRTLEALMDRCQQLLRQQEQDHQSTITSGNCTNRQSARPLSFGPSPPVLNRWSIDWNRRDSKVVGQLEDGRTIWLHYHCIGRLDGDPLSDAASPSVLSLVSGGYLEAIGGRIYELGEARERIQVRSPLVDPMDPSAADIISIPSSASDLKRGESLDWLLPPVTASVSAFLACTVLSACIGYGAGLSLMSDGHHAADANSSLNPMPVSVPSKVRDSATSSSSSSMPSITEQKARAEYRILREQRLLQRLAERLEQDQKELMELQQKGDGI